MVLLQREGYQTSASTVGRILNHARERGVLVEPRRMSVKMRKRLWSRPYATRKPKGWTVERPGDLVQVDTVDLARHTHERRRACQDFCVNPSDRNPAFELDGQVVECLAPLLNRHCPSG